MYLSDALHYVSVLKLTSSILMVDLLRICTEKLIVSDIIMLKKMSIF